MEIKYIGHSSFYIRTKSAKIVTDPFDPKSTGLSFPSTEADIVSVSHPHDDHNYTAGIKGSPLVITWPGEYEKNQVRITGYKSYHDKKNGAERGENVIFKFEADDFSILHCGDLGHILSDELVAEIGNVDIVMIPVGGIYTVGPDEAVKVLKEIEPAIVIPMHYGRPELNQQVFSGLSPLAVFLKSIGATDVAPVDKLILKREEMNAEEMKVVILNS